MAELQEVRPSTFEAVDQWMNNLRKSKTPCFLCKHKTGGNLLFEMVCNAFPGALIPPFIFNATSNHDAIFKGNTKKTNVFINRYEKQSTDLVFEFDKSHRIINELLEHPYTQMINEIDPEEAEAFRDELDKFIKKFRKE